MVYRRATEGAICFCTICSSKFSSPRCFYLTRVPRWTAFSVSRCASWALGLASVYPGMGIHDSRQVSRLCYKSGPYVHTWWAPLCPSWTTHQRLFPGAIYSKVLVGAYARIDQHSGAIHVELSHHYARRLQIHQHKFSFFLVPCPCSCFWRFTVFPSPL